MLIDNKVLDACERLWSYYGADNQLVVAIEELAELQKELTKMLRGKSNLLNLIEETADVELMLAQLKLGYDTCLAVGIHNGRTPRRVAYEYDTVIVKDTLHVLAVLDCQLTLKLMGLNTHCATLAQAISDVEVALDELKIMLHIEQQGVDAIIEAKIDRALADIPQEANA